MAIISQKELFSWKEIEKYSDLERLKLVIENIPDEELMIELEKERKKGRNDFPVRAMWNSILAKIIYQHPSEKSLIRELKRNPSLAQLCGFNIFAGKKGIPSSWNYTRFSKKLFKHKEKIRKIFEKLVELIYEALPDMGKNLGIDSKAIPSFSKGKKKVKLNNKKRDGRRDTEANWGVKKYKGIDKDGNYWEKKKTWYGYKIHIIGDLDYELPIGFKLTRASESDVVHTLPLVREVYNKHKNIIEKSETFSADKGYDCTDTIIELQKKYNIKPIIDIRNCWDKTEQERLLNPEKADNITYDYAGNVYCYCPKTGTKHSMAFSGYEKSRKTLKYICPAKEYGIKCKGKKECCGANKSKIVRIPLEKDPRIFLPISRSSYKFKRIYSKRTAIERINSRLDVSYGFEKHYIRGFDKMETACSIAFIVMLGMAYGRIKQKKPYLMRSLVKSA